MKYFPAAVRTVFEIPPLLLPAAESCGVIRRRVKDERALVSVAENPLPGTLPLRTRPHLRVRT